MKQGFREYSTITEAAEFMRVTAQQSQQWRATGRGPDYTELRTGSVIYDTRDMKVYLREQLDFKKRNAALS